MSALDTQVGGNHYKKYEYQPIEYFMDSKMNPLSSKISKYVIRYKDKNGLEDLEKALQLSEIGVEKYMRSRNYNKALSENTLHCHSHFLNQLDESLTLEREILTASLYEDYRLCVILIYDLMDKEYSNIDDFDYFSKLLDYAEQVHFDVYRYIHSKRHDSEEFLFIAAFVFVLHKYDISINNISKKLKCDQNMIKTIIFKGYELLENENNSFIFDMESMFNHVEKERLCKK